MFPRADSLLMNDIKGTRWIEISKYFQFPAKIHVRQNRK